MTSETSHTQMKRIIIASIFVVVGNFQGRKKPVGGGRGFFPLVLSH